MKRVLLLLLIPFILFANEPINECVTDVYFANGIMNTELDAYKSLGLIEDEILHKFYNGDKSKMLKRHNFDTAYNKSYGMAPDLFESFLQKVDDSYVVAALWSGFKVWVGQRLRNNLLTSITRKSLCAHFYMSFY